MKSGGWVEEAKIKWGKVRTIKTSRCQCEQRTLKMMFSGKHEFVVIKNTSLLVFRDSHL